MIHTNRIVTVGEQESIIDRPIVLYRGDREVEIEFELVGNEFQFSTEGNVIKSVNASHGQLVLNTPSGENMFSELAECHEGKVVFVVTKEMIDEFIEMGFYSFQIRLYDSVEMKSRVTIPPILKGFDIRNPIAAEDETNVVDMATVDYARIYKDQSNEELPTFDWMGNYNKTEWEHGDVVTENKMNKIEDAIWTVNNMRSESDNVFLKKVEEINKQRQNDVDKLNAKDSELSKAITDGDRIITNEVNALRVDMEVGDLTVKNELTEYVDGELAEVNSQLEHMEATVDTVEGELEYKASKYDLEVERKRIDLLVKTENNQTEGNAELLDIRIGIDGIEYETAGDAIRTQFNNINDAVIDLNNGVYITENYFNYNNIILDKIPNSYTGQTVNDFSAMDRWVTSELLEVKEDDIYCLMYDKTIVSLSNYIVNFYDVNGNFVSNLQSTGASLNNFTIPKNIKYMYIFTSKAWLLRDRNTQIKLFDLNNIDYAYRKYGKSTSIRNIEDVSFPIYFDVENGVVNIISKYGNNKDIRFVINKKGPNNLYDFEKIYKIDNASKDPDRNIYRGDLFMNNITDFFGPYKVVAINNIDGDNKKEDGSYKNIFTGGNHDYNNSGTGGDGLATAKNVSFKCCVNGKQYTDFRGYCNFIDLYWTNRIQAQNTTKNDGTGREVLEEKIHLHFDGYKFTVDNEITALEDVGIQTYYGLQAYVAQVDPANVFFRGSLVNRGANTSVGSGSNSGDLNCNSVICESSTDRIEMNMLNYDLGKFLISGGTYSAHASSNKIYYDLINRSSDKRFSLNINEKICYKGEYIFTPAREII